MSFAQEGMYYARNAGADLSAKLFHLAKIDTDSDIILAGDGDACAGVITEAAVADKPVTIQYGGIAKVICGGTIAAGAKVASDGNGQGVLATTGEFAIGMALEAGASGRIIAVMLREYGRVA